MPPTVAQPVHCFHARHGGVHWTIRSAADAERLLPLLQDPEDCLRSANPLFRSVPALIGRVPPPHPDLPPLALRSLTYARPLHRLRDTFRPTRAARAFAGGLRLEALGIRTARVLAAGSQRRWLLPTRAYLITEWLDHTQTLGQFVQTHHGLPRDLTTRLADLLAGLHRHGLSHRDLREANVLVDPDGVPWLIDLDGLRFPPFVSEFYRVVDLARFGREFSQSPLTLRWQGARFMHRYCEQRGVPERCRPLTAQVVRRLQKIGVRLPATHARS